MYKERPMVVGELESVLVLDPSELRAGQARLDHAAAQVDQAAGGPSSQLSPSFADHARTVPGSRSA
jgi:hypothetical protein